MLGRVKVAVREAIPAGLQVPLKYWVDRTRGRLEPEMRLLPDLIRTGERVVDVGGNRGSYAYAMARLGARVEVFEPNPACLRVLRAWAVGKDVAVHDVGLSDHEGAIDLHVPVDAAGVEHDASASMEPHDFTNSHVRRVRLQRLDDHAFDDVSLVKIDVEGHESKVLAGAVDTLARNMPAILVEIEQRHLKCPIEDVFQQVQSLGYEGYFLDRGGLWPLSRFDPERDQAASSFARPGARYINNFLFLDAERRVRMPARLFANA